MTLILYGTPTWARHVPAPEVQPVVHEGIEYVAPNDNGARGYIRAQNPATGEKLWDKTVFRVIMKPFLEKDVQWVLISSMELKENSLIITDERSRSYSLDLKSKEVKHLKNK